ncbi:hypothetical protein [Knoellia sp. p5-6-4]|nr:hypothetical protein [Knoellia sp. p5-6-4]MDF2144141.1 hypothetical protein [Knoellia sp. p5-6-4]
MPLRDQCPVCWWSVRCDDGKVVEHDRDSYGQLERCPGSDKPVAAGVAAA